MKILRVTLAQDDQSKIKKLLPPKNKYEIEETDGTSYNNGYTIYLSKGSNNGRTLRHELFHITGYAWEDKFKQEVLNAGKTAYVKAHPLARRYSERDFLSEDFVAAAEDWVRGNYRTTVRMGWQTEEESESRMKFFEKHFG
jgi:hypothetical protein